MRRRERMLGMRLAWSAGDGENFAVGPEVTSGFVRGDELTIPSDDTQDERSATPSQARSQRSLDALRGACRLHITDRPAIIRLICESSGRRFSVRQRHRRTSCDDPVTESGVAMRSYCCDAVGQTFSESNAERTQSVLCWTFPPPTGILCRATSPLVPRPDRCLGHLVHRRVNKRGRAPHVSHARQPRRRTRPWARTRPPRPTTVRWLGWITAAASIELDVVGVTRRPAQPERVYLPQFLLLCGACRVAPGGNRRVRLHVHRPQAGRLSRRRVAERRA